MIADLILWFGLGTYGFYFLLTVAFGLIITCEEFEADVPAFLILLGTLVSMHWLAHISFGWPFHHPIECLGYLIAYVLIGIAWTLFKWTRYVTQSLSVYLNLKEHLKGQGYHGIELGSRLLPQLYGYGNEFPPTPKQNKGRIIRWLYYWPFSATWYLVHVPITEFYNLIYTNMTKALQAISDRIFKSALAETAIEVEADKDAKN